MFTLLASLLALALKKNKQKKKRLKIDHKNCMCDSNLKLAIHMRLWLAIKQQIVCTSDPTPNVVD